MALSETEVLNIADAVIRMVDEYSIDEYELWHAVDVRIQLARQEIVETGVAHADVEEDDLIAVLEKISELELEALDEEYNES